VPDKKNEMAFYGHKKMCFRKTLQRAESPNRVLWKPSRPTGGVVVLGVKQFVLKCINMKRGRLDFSKITLYCVYRRNVIV